MQTLPEFGFLRERQLIGRPRAKIPEPAIIPTTKSTLRRWIHEGKFPAPIRLAGTKTSVWKVEDVKAWIAAQSARAAA